MTLTITDDEEAPALTIADAELTEGDSGESALAFAVALDPPSASAVTVDWVTSDGTAAAGTDYAAGSGSLTFNAGEASGTVSVAVLGDNVDEPDETFTVTLSNASGAAIGRAAATGTIRDDDDPPRVTLLLTPDTIAEAGGVSAVTAALDRPSSVDTTVAVSAAAVSPAAADGFALAGSALTIAAGRTDSVGTVTITAADNGVYEGDRQVTVSGAASNALGVSGPDPVALTIMDDEDPPALSIADAGLDEGDSGESALAFAVALDPPSASAVTVDWATSDGTAAAGADYAAGTGSLTFNAGDAGGTVSVAVLGDNVDEPDETFRVTLSGASGATIARAASTGTIRDDDDPPRVTLLLTPDAIAEAGGVSAVTAALDRPSSVDTTVAVSAAAVSPAAAGGFTLAGSALTIAAGRTDSVGTVTITAVDNGVYEGDRQVAVSGAATNALGVSGPDPVALTITDDEDPPALSIADAGLDEGDSGESALAFTVALDPPSASAVTVDWATSDGTAAAGTDYAAGTGSLTITAGDAGGTVSVSVLGDDVDEPDETFRVTLSGASGATIARAASTGTIRDDDDPPRVTLLLTPDAIAEAGGVSAVTAALDRPSSVDTTVAVSAAAVSPAAADGFALAGSVLTIPAGRTDSAGTVTITAADNDVHEGDRQVTVSGAATNALGVSGPDPVTLTITDDEEAPVLSIAGAELDEGDSGESALAFTVALDPPSASAVTVDWATSDGTAAAGTDYRAGSGSLTFDAGDAGGTVSVVVLGDDVDEPDETFTVTLSNASGATVEEAAATGTIRDDDDPPKVTLLLTPDAVAEAGGVSTVTATLDRPSSVETTVAVSAEAVPPAASGDFALAGSELTIPAGRTDSAGSVTITAVDNDVHEGDRQVAVSGAVTNPLGVSGPDPVTLTIADDDPPPLPVVTVSAVSERISEGEAAEFELSRTGDPSRALTVAVEVSERGGDMVPAASEGVRRVAFAAGASTAPLRVATVDDRSPEPDSLVTAAVSEGGGSYEAGRPGSATVVVADGGGPSVLGEGRRSGAASLLRRHVERFSRLTSDLALGRLDEGRRAASSDAGADGEGAVSDGAAAGGSPSVRADGGVKDGGAAGRGARTPGGAAGTGTVRGGESGAGGDALAADGGVKDGGAAGRGARTPDGAAGAGTFGSGESSPEAPLARTPGGATARRDRPSGAGTAEVAGTKMAAAAGVRDPAAPAPLARTAAGGGAAPRVTLVLIPDRIAEAGGTSAVTARLDRPSSRATTVVVLAAPGGCTLSGSRLTIPAGGTESAGPLTIAAVDDDAVTADRTVTVSGFAFNLGGITGPDAVTLTIMDDDGGAPAPPRAYDR